MKTLFIAVVLSLSSVSAFADVSGCQKLLGDFTCNYEGEAVPLSIRSVSATKLSIDVAGEGEVIVVDGNLHRSTKSDDNYSATCDAETGLYLVSTFKDKPAQVITISPTSSGVVYSMQSKNLSLTCNK